MEFGQGNNIPLVKHKTGGDMSSLNNYHALTLIPIISKIFELILLEVCDEYLNSDNRQFGFKKHLGCASAIFAIRI